MPQMSPMSWITLFIGFSLIFLLVMVKFHYMKLSPNLVGAPDKLIKVSNFSIFI